MNVTEALEWPTFDIMVTIIAVLGQSGAIHSAGHAIDELTFRDTFGAVRDARPNYWVSILLSVTYGASVAGLKNRLPLLKYVLPYIIPKGALKDYARHHALTIKKVCRGIDIGDGNNREDFFAGIIGKGSLSKDQIAAEATVFITASAETTATILTVALYFLAINHSSYAQLRHEIRSTLAILKDIGDSTAGLPDLKEVLDETMLIFPPSPVGRPLKSSGEFVDGIYVPEAVYASTDIMSLHRGPGNATSPLTWLPERWIEGDGKSGKPYTVLFSIGPRACLGIHLAWLEMRIVLAKLTFTMYLELISEDDDWPHRCSFTQL